jgi:hypothetical protein
VLKKKGVGEIEGRNPRKTTYFPKKMLKKIIFKLGIPLKTC